MHIYGYARVSTTDQDLTTQVEKLKAAGCVIVRTEKVSGTSMANRDELALVLSLLAKGDILMVTKVDRLARSIGDLQEIVKAIKTKGAFLRATDQPIDTSNAAGKAFLDMLGVFAEFETNLRKERQLEGIAKAKAAGVYRGRAPSVDGEAVRKLRGEGKGPTEIAKMLKVGRASVYRALSEAA